MILRIWKITKRVAASGLAVAVLEGTHVVGSENETVLQPQEIVLPGHEHPERDAKAYAGIDWRYPLAAVTTSSGTSRTFLREM